MTLSPLSSGDQWSNHIPDARERARRKEPQSSHTLILWREILFAFEIYYTGPSRAMKFLGIEGRDEREGRHREQVVREILSDLRTTVQGIRGFKGSGGKGGQS